MSKIKTILIADDDSDFLESIEYSLLNKGYNVITGKNGAEAVKRYTENKPDITFLDIKMPVMDGYEAFFKIKKNDPNAKIVFVTGFAVHDERYEKAKESNLSGLLTKPFSIKDLEELITKYSSKI